MIFAPVRLGETSLNAEAVAADKKSCKRFGPCGVGKEALFLNSYFIDRRYYVAFSSVRRVFKRVAMSQGGFSGQGVFGAIPYLVVQYDGGKEKQCTFKREEDVDAMLAYIGEVHPEIPTLSVGGEQRLEQKAKEEAARYLSELTSDAQSAKEELEKAQKFLSGDSSSRAYSSSVENDRLLLIEASIPSTLKSFTAYSQESSTLASGSAVLMETSW